MNTPASTPAQRGLGPKQLSQLLTPIEPRRVMIAQKQSHLPAYDVVAHLTRIFGFEGWDKEVLAIDLVQEDGVPDPNKNNRMGWTVTYRCLMRLTLRDPFGNIVKIIEDGACGSANNLPSRGDAHDFAYKNAISYAIKRCAKDLGDQFGLSLYNKGSVEKLLGGTLVRLHLLWDQEKSSVPEPESSENVEAHVPTPQSMGNDERQHEDTAEVEPEAPAPAAKKAAAKKAAPAKTDPAPPPTADPAEEPTSRAPAATDGPKLTPNQLKKMQTLRRELGIQDTVFRAQLELDYGVTSSKDLGRKDAAEVIDRLEKAKAKRDAAEAAAEAKVNPAPAPSESDAPEPEGWELNGDDPYAMGEAS